jgi:hypothetical protein
VRKNATTAGKQAVPQDDTLAGKKRKNPKLVYVPRTPVAQPPTEVNAGALVISGGNTLATIVHAQEAQVDEASDDSNKKQRTEVHRSADQAAADAQPRRTQ